MKNQLGDQRPGAHRERGGEKDTKICFDTNLIFRLFDHTFVLEQWLSGNASWLPGFLFLFLLHSRYRFESLVLSQPSCWATHPKR